jgi:hypothetical protein
LAAVLLVLPLGCGEDSGREGGGGTASGTTTAAGTGSGVAGSGGGVGGGAGGTAGAGGTPLQCDDPDGDGYGTGPECLGEDCSPYNAGVHPGAEERCDGFDQDCDDVPDQGLTCNPALWVFLLAGQSNMVGLGFNSELPAGQQGAVAGGHIFYDDTVHPNSNTLQWLPLAPGFGVANGRFGPELTFGRRVRALWPDRTIAIIKVAEGATALEDRWAAGTGDLYQLLVNHVNDEMQDISQDWRPQIAGLVWMQGESDAMSLSSANAYGNNLHAFLLSLRADLDVAGMPATAGLINPDGGWQYATAVRNHTVGVSDWLGQVATVETNDLPLQAADPAHYTSQSFITLGQRFAEAATALVPASFSNVTDFTQAQGDGYWAYLERESGTSTLLGWSAAASRFQNDDSSVTIGQGWVQPSSTSEAEIAWWAPYRGRATVTVSVSDLEPGSGDGVQIEVVQDGEVIRGPQTVPNGGSAGHTIEVDVDQATLLAFRTSAGSAQVATGDRTSWDIAITMEASAY